MLRLKLILLMLISLLSTAVGQAGDQCNAFVYHRFGDPRYPTTNTPLETFRAHLEILRQGDYTVLPLGSVIDALRSGRPLPERCAALTVDDAYRSFLTGAIPLLREYGFPVTLFVSSDTVGSTDFLDWTELRRLADSGVEIGNHSAAHVYLLDRKPSEPRDAWRLRVAGDLQRAQRELSSGLGRTPELFAYPYGEYDVELLKIVREVGFKAAAVQHSGVITPRTDPYVLPRFPMATGFDAPDEFAGKLRMKALEVDVLEPAGPLLGDENPPLLRFRLHGEGIAQATLKCYVAGQPPAEVRKVPDETDVYEVRARQPLTGRRNKYNLTASDGSGRQWFWFSQLWVKPLR